MKVIYVDDEKPSLFNFQYMVSDLADIQDVHIFTDGVSAIEWAKQNQVDAAFLDIHMPMMNGLTLAKKLKELQPNICIEFITAYQQYAMEAYGVDAIGYVLKPYGKDDILKEINKIRSYMVKKGLIGR